MSRLIKDFGYVEKYEDTIQCYVSDIEQLEFIDIGFKISKDYKERGLQVKIKASASEEETGFVTLTALSDNLNVNIKIKEEDFANAMFEAIVDYNSELWLQPDIVSWYYALIRKAAKALIEQGYWVQMHDATWTNSSDKFSTALKDRLKLIIFEQTN